MRPITKSPPRYGPLFWYLPWALLLFALAGLARADEAPDPDKAAAAVAERVGKERTEAKARALTDSEPLARAARALAEYMAKTGQFGHDVDGKQPHERAATAGYDSTFVAENISQVS